MHLFRDILVGVELSQNAEVLPATQQAIHSAQWLAEQTAANLTFFTALHSEQGIAAEQTLAALVEAARKAGLQASAVVVRGNPVDAIIKQAAEGAHDLVVIGAPAGTGLTYRLAGSTATRLLHECRQPLWFAVKGASPSVKSVLVASDLTVVSDNAVRLGTVLGQALQARVRALTVVAYPLDHHWSTGDRDSLTIQYHREVREDAEEKLREELARLGCPGEIEVKAVGRSEMPDVEVLEYVREHPTDLIVLGMTDRGWLQEKLFGSSAELVLSHSPCSVLVVKPDGYHGGTA